MSNGKIKNLRGNAITEEINARKNINLKKKILQNWSVEGIPVMKDADGNEIRNAKGDLQLDYYPRSLSAFCKWNGSQNCEGTQKTIDKKYGGIRGTGRDTLRNKYPETHEVIDGIIKSLKLKEKQQEVKICKGTIIDELSSENLMLKKTKEVVEIQYRQLLQRISSLTSELKEEKSAHRSSRKIWGNEVSILETQINSLKVRNSELNEALAKVKKLGIVDNDK